MKESLKYLTIPMKSIYVVENERGLVKIGVSQNVDQRLKTLSKQGGFTICHLYATESCSNAFKIENYVHKCLRKYRINGEWFSVSYEEALKVVKKAYVTMAQLRPKKQKCLTPEDIDSLFKMSY